MATTDADAERLMDVAFGHLNADQPLAAILVGRTLQRMRYSGCFEVRALALERTGRNSAAVRVLRHGVFRAPKAWVLWMMLGNVLSDLRRYDEAFDAYRSGMAVASDLEDRVAIEANHAHALRRSGQPARAIEKATWCLNASVSPALRAFSQSVFDGAKADIKPKPRRLFGRK